MTKSIRLLASPPALPNPPTEGKTHSPAKRPVSLSRKGDAA